MRVSVHVKPQQAFAGVARWYGEAPWPSIPDRQESVHCCSDSGDDLGVVLYRTWIMPNGSGPGRAPAEVEIIVQHHGDWNDLREHLMLQHSDWEVEPR